VETQTLASLNRRPEEGLLHPVVETQKLSSLNASINIIIGFNRECVAPVAQEYVSLLFLAIND